MAPTVKDQVITAKYVLYNGDAVEVLKGMEDETVGLSIFSPPFLRIYIRTRTKPGTWRTAGTTGPSSTTSASW